MFEDNIDVKIGRVLFEKQSGKELYDVAHSMKKFYDDSGREDKVAGTMAIELAVAAFFEGYPAGAALASFCMLDKTGYKGLSNVWIPFEVYTEAGSKVIPLCAYHMGEIYDDGYPPYTIGNPYVAALWYKKAADAGNAKAQCEMGNRYMDGKGVEIDFDLAEKYWELGAKQGNVACQFNLGCLCDGCLAGAPMTSYDPEKAGYWLAQAAKNGHKEAAEVLNASYRYNQRKNQWQKVY